MNLREWIWFLYGITLGTSTPLIDLSARPHRPLSKKTLAPGLTAFIGGVANCVALQNNEATLLINTNMAEAAEEIMRSVGTVTQIVNQRAHPYFVGGNEFYPEARDIYVGAYARASLIQQFGDRKIPNRLVTEKIELDWGGTKIVIEPISEGQFAKNLIVFLPQTKTLLLGDLFYNRVFPIFKGYAQVDVQSWIALLENILSRYQPAQIIPGEGEIATANDVATFTQFLNDMSRGSATASSSAAFAAFAEKYPWENIEGLSSLVDSLNFFKKVASKT